MTKKYKSDVKVCYLVVTDTIIALKTYLFQYIYIYGRMNWVGGSRNRLVMKNDAKKQREFFERIKMQRRLEKFGVPRPSSSTPGDTSCGSTDLMTLFIVNQIATKKENKDPPTVSVLGRFNERSRDRRNEPLVLPMSPCSPSQLSLVGSPSQCSFSTVSRVHNVRKRKHVFPQKLHCRQLSPVVESAFSDNSASDYLAPVTVPCSPASSGSSGQGIFPLQMNCQNQLQLLPCYSPPPWDTSVLHQSQFQPFSQPRRMTDSVSWSSKSNPFELETPTAAQVLFSSPEPESSEIKNGGVDAFFHHQPEEPMNFSLNLPEIDHPFEEDVFRFGGEDDKAEGFNDRNPTSKMYLTDEVSLRSSAPQTVPTAQNSGVELSNVNSSCLDQNTGLLNGGEYLPSCCCSAGYLSSHSSDDESCCEPCLAAPAFYTNEARSEDNTETTQKSANLSEPGPHTRINPGDEQIMVDQTSTPSSSPRGRILCTCKKGPAETREAGTQTTPSCTPETCDASTQCASASAPVAGPQPEPQNSTRQAGWSLWNPLQDAFRPRAEAEGSSRNEPTSDGGREEVRGHPLSEEEVLQEIANILLLLKQKKEKVDRQTYRK